MESGKKGDTYDDVITSRLITGRKGRGRLFIKQSSSRLAMRPKAS